MSLLHIGQAKRHTPAMQHKRRMIKKIIDCARRIIARKSDADMAGQSSCAHHH